jgi:hypothetical protein
MFNQTIIFPCLPEKTYGDGSFSPGAVAVYSDGPNAGLPTGLEITYISSNPGVAIVNGGSIEIQGAGSTIITAHQYGDLNHNPAQESQDWQVFKAVLHVTADDMRRRYKCENPSEYKLNFYPFVNGDTEEDLSNKPSATCPASTSSPAGAYAILAVGGSDDNYTFDPVVRADVLSEFDLEAQGVLQVLKANQWLEIEHPPAETQIFYGDPVPQDAKSCAMGGGPDDFTKYDTGLTVRYFMPPVPSGGIPNTSVLGPDPLTGEMITLRAGQTSVTALQDGDANYHPAAPLDTPLDVLKVELHPYVDTPQTREYRQYNPDMLGASYSPWKYATYIPRDENGYTFTDTPSGRVAVDIMDPGGVYSSGVICFGGMDKSYSFAPASEQFEIEKTEQRIIFPILEPRRFGDAPFTLEGDSLAKGIGDPFITPEWTADPPYVIYKTKLAITYTSSDPKIARIDKVDAGPDEESMSVVTILDIGAVTITATQDGDENYESAPPVARTLTIAKGQPYFISASHMYKKPSDKEDDFFTDLVMSDQNMAPALELAMVADMVSENTDVVTQVWKSGRPALHVTGEVGQASIKITSPAGRLWLEGTTVPWWNEALNPPAWQSQDHIKVTVFVRDDVAEDLKFHPSKIFSTATTTT